MCYITFEVLFFIEFVHLLVLLIMTVMMTVMMMMMMMMMIIIIIIIMKQHIPTLYTSIVGETNSVDFSESVYLGSVMIRPNRHVQRS